MKKELSELQFEIEMLKSEVKHLKSYLWFLLSLFAGGMTVIIAWFK